ncbi:MAG: D-alanine--D-alanine ligase, partial [Chitinivibrionales bacterium]
MAKKQIFIVGLDDFNLKMLKNTPEAEECEFLPALYVSEMRDVESLEIDKLLETCFKRIEENEKIDAIASYYDFPGTALVPVIAEKYNLPGADLQSVFKCEHKYWSRLEQSKVISEHIPEFAAFDPFDVDAYQKISMIPPFWIKPIKSFRSFLAYNINSETQFYENIKEVQEHVEFITEPFKDLLRKYKMPAEFTEMKENCIAESTISGHQCTVEG